ncbi:MAG TPA: ChbG/HpnK family deacetylase, partial [Anaerolineae bacterium]|nr:ChbG/HpnK family deacetylase [Anaerolineae bacterium]
MSPNPTLKKLGFSPNDRVAIIHCDDIGLCQASVSAFSDLWEFGLITSGATMLPCAWAMEAAALCQKTPQVDMGVHLTLTSEWPTYRWSPLSTRDPASGLLDPQGFFYHTTAQAQAHGDPQAVRRELQTQIDHAIANGITPTHIDTHMGTVAHPKFIPSYFQLALQYKLPPMFMRLDEAGWRNLGYDAATASLAAQLVNQLEAAGIP